MAQGLAVRGILAKPDRVRLAKLLGMLGSDHPGERDNAACAAQRLVRERGLTWEQVLAVAPLEHQQPQMGVWRETVAQCLEHPGKLRPWEKGFLIDLPKFRRLSTKQRYILNEIAMRVRGAGSNS